MEQRAPAGADLMVAAHLRCLAPLLCQGCDKEGNTDTSGYRVGESDECSFGCMRMVMLGSCKGRGAITAMENRVLCVDLMVVRAAGAVLHCWFN